MSGILDQHLVEKKPQLDPAEKRIYLLMALLIIGAIVGTLLAWNDVESIIGSGPTVSIIGFLLVIKAFKEKNKTLLVLGCIPTSISIFWLVMVNVYELSPSDCKVLIPSSLSFATMLLIVGGIYFLKNKS